MKKLILLAALGLIALMATPAGAHGWGLAFESFERDNGAVPGANIRGRVQGSVSSVHDKVHVEVFLSKNTIDGWTVVGYKEKTCENTDSCNVRTEFVTYDCHRDYAVAGGVEAKNVGEAYHAFDGSGTTFKWATC